MKQQTIALFVAVLCTSAAHAQVPANQYGQFRLDVVIANCTAMYGQGTPAMQQCAATEMKRELAIMCAKARAVGANLDAATEQQCKQVKQ